MSESSVILHKDAQGTETNKENELWFKNKVETGLRDIQEGKTFSHMEVKTRSLARQERLLRLNVYTLNND